MVNLISDYIFKDVLQFGLIKMTGPIKKVLALLAYQIGSEISVNGLAGSLGMARQTIERYLDLLEKTFIIFSFFREMKFHQENFFLGTTNSISH
ncbi:MAG: DUF4143 domain-containing protein [Proteobacteria bacterium]|nr:DUF4143 domain-containing protein [Pseudomonadota bacterium]